MFKKIRPYSAGLALSLGIFALVVAPSQIHSLSAPTKFSLIDESSLLLAQQQQPRTALVIGNAAYLEDALVNPVNDATDIAEALRSLGFEVTLLLDQDLRAMKGALETFNQQLQIGGVGVFYYAGHGIQVDGENYLIPLNARLERQSDVRFEALALGQVLNAMEDSDAEVKIVMIDACRDNPFHLRLRSGTRTLSTQRGLAFEVPPEGTIISFATSPGREADDGEGRNSPYTASLLRHIKTPNLDVNAVFRAVRADVMNTTQQRQVPWYQESLVGSFFFEPGSIEEREEDPPNGGVYPRVSSWNTSYHQPEYRVENFAQNSDALKFNVGRNSNTRSSIAWGIQIYSSTPVKLESGRRYKLQFQVSASQPFELVARLGEQDYRRSIFIDRVFNVGGLDPATFEVEFTAENFTQNSHLYFQAGNAPDGTQIEIRNVQFLEVAD